MGAGFSPLPSMTPASVLFSSAWSVEDAGGRPGGPRRTAPVSLKKLIRWILKDFGQFECLAARETSGKGARKKQLHGWRLQENPWEESFGPLWQSRVSTNSQDLANPSCLTIINNNKNTNNNNKNNNNSNNNNNNNSNNNHHHHMRLLTNSGSRTLLRPKPGWTGNHFFTIGRRYPQKHGNPSRTPKRPHSERPGPT